MLCGNLETKRDFLRELYRELYCMYTPSTLGVDFRRFKHNNSTFQIWDTVSPNEFTTIQRLNGYLSAVDMLVLLHPITTENRTSIEAYAIENQNILTDYYDNQNGTILEYLEQIQKTVTQSQAEKKTKAEAAAKTKAESGNIATLDDGAFSINFNRAAKVNSFTMFSFTDERTSFAIIRQGETLKDKDSPQAEKAAIYKSQI